MKQVFVTGGSGFLGRNLIQQLVSQNIHVKALSRSEISAKILSELGAEPIQGDVNDLDGLKKGISGCDTVFHLAAKVEVDGKYEDHLRITFQGTENVLKIATQEEACKTFVHCSTESVLLGDKPLVNADETWPYPKHTVGYYGQTKKLAEQAVVNANGDALRTVVIRPRLIWGKGDTVLIPAFSKAFKEGQWKWIGGGEHKTSTTHVSNVVEGLLRAQEKGKGGEIYFILDEKPVVFKEFITEMMKAGAGLDFSQCGTLPKWLASTVSFFGFIPAPVPKLFGEECTLNDRKAREELGYIEKVTIEQGLKELAEQFEKDNQMDKSEKE